MKSILTYINVVLVSLASLFVTAACVDEEEFDDSPRGNFEALWKIVDEHYCFFDYKQKEYGLDWNDVYDKYRVRVDDGMTGEQLFEVLTDMLAELRDGHVNLATSYDFGRYWSWHEGYPSNVSDTLLRRYLGTDYKIAAGLKYKILDDNIGYVRYESFNDAIGEGNIDEVINHFLLCRGLIIDIRGNGGGLLTNAERLAARFTNTPVTVGYMQHKTGPGHNDFSTMEELLLKPSCYLRWQKPVCVLTNRKVYSAANEFVKYMHCLPGVTIVGDRTGGGAGMPFTSMLPNGWAVRFSACPMYDRDGRSTEFGIAPDYEVSLTDSDFADGTDTIIEFARRMMGSNSDEL